MNHVIPVLAGGADHYLEGCVNNNSTELTWSNKRTVLTKSFLIHPRAKTDSMCYFPAAKPREKRGAVKNNNKQINKLQLWGLTNTPPPSRPIKRHFLRTSTKSTADRNHVNPCRETEYSPFPSLYHKYINYANYDHCILTPTHFLSPFRCSAQGASLNPVRVLTLHLPRKGSWSSVIPPLWVLVTVCFSHTSLEIHLSSQTGAVTAHKDSYLHW